VIRVTISGNDIHQTMRLPAIPRKGDFLWLSSLVGHSDGIPREVIVSKVEWARDQADRYIDKENEGVHVWITVRRTKEE